MKVKALVTQSCPTLGNPMDCRPPGSSVHVILQARTLAWVAFLSPVDLPNLGIESGSPASRQILYGLSHQRSHIYYDI